MVDVRKDTRGPGAMKGVDLAVIHYDNAKHEVDGKVVTQWADVRVHPDSDLGKGQSNLALVTKNGKDGAGPNRTHPYKTSQMDKVIEAAGDNVAPLLDKDGTKVGNVYGVKADLMIPDKDMMFNSKKLEPSDLSVATENGVTIMDRIIEAQSTAKAAKAAEATVEAPEDQAQVEEQVQASSDEPELG